MVDMEVSVVRTLPPCAGYSICSSMVEGLDAQGTPYRRRCTRKALFMVETPGHPTLTACRLHAGPTQPEVGRR
ncbi:MAG: hypothetical protein QOK40_515 [Miltoncostaeaceae bacterium]|jgi:hypothetical protein|nr:hypothetical protein [Miltoncostaeaceae bacterium]